MSRDTDKERQNREGQEPDTAPEPDTAKEPEGRTGQTAQDTSEQEPDSGEAGEQAAGEDGGENPESGEKAEGEKAGEEKAGEEKAGAKGGRKDPRDAQIEELQDRLRRQMAEFDNFRKRTEKEKSAMYEIGARDIIEKILPVLDNFERGLAAMPEDLKGNSFAEGVEMIYKQFVKTLTDAGVEAIEAVGQTFDPNLHNAVMHIEDEAFGENEVSQELQKGYKYRGTVVRHSMVQVAN